jgi:hypothetical protein
MYTTKALIAKYRRFVIDKFRMIFTAASFRHVFGRNLHVSTSENLDSGQKHAGMTDTRVNYLLRPLHLRCCL